MRKKASTSNSAKRKQKKGAGSAGGLQRAAGGEIHQIAGGEPRPPRSGRTEIACSNWSGPRNAFRAEIPGILIFR